MYRHEVNKNGDIFRSIVVITQLVIDSGEELFQCGYRDSSWKNILDALTNST